MTRSDDDGTLKCRHTCIRPFMSITPVRCVPQKAGHNRHSATRKHVHSAGMAQRVSLTPSMAIQPAPSYFKPHWHAWRSLLAQLPCLVLSATNTGAHNIPVIYNLAVPVQTVSTSHQDINRPWGWHASQAPAVAQYKIQTTIPRRGIRGSSLMTRRTWTSQLPASWGHGEHGPRRLGALGRGWCGRLDRRGLLVVRRAPLHEPGLGIFKARLEAKLAHLGVPPPLYSQRGSLRNAGRNTGDATCCTRLRTCPIRNL